MSDYVPPNVEPVESEAAAPEYTPPDTEGK